MSVSDKINLSLNCVAEQLGAHWPGSVALGREDLGSVALGEVLDLPAEETPKIAC